MPASTEAVIIYGPQGCGKTTHATALAKHYGKSEVIDDPIRLYGREKFPAHALVLTNEPMPGAIEFADAAIEAGITLPEHPVARRR